MPAVVRGTQVSCALHRASLGGALLFADGHAAAVFPAGVSSIGLVEADAPSSLIRVRRSGGALVLTIKNAVPDASLAAAGRIALAGQNPPCLSMPGEAGSPPGRAVALRVL